MSADSYALLRARSEARDLRLKLERLERELRQVKDERDRLKVRLFEYGRT